MARGIQEMDVWQAADALLLEGERPTIERVRLRIGRGSPNTVSPMLDTWFRHLGRRIQDPLAFAAPSGVPDPVLQVAQHLWETSLAQARAEFDEKLSAGLAVAKGHVETAQAQAVRAELVAADANERAGALLTELGAQSQLLELARQELAAERARLTEVRTAHAAAVAQLSEQQEQAMAAQDVIKRDLIAMQERADAADRRVAIELDRERTARGRAERQAEVVREQFGAAQVAREQTDHEHRRKLEAAAGQLASLKDELAVANVERAASQAREAVARDQMGRLQLAVERLSDLNDRVARRVRRTRLTPDVSRTLKIRR